MEDTRFIPTDLEIATQRRPQDRQAGIHLVTAVGERLVEFLPDVTDDDIRVTLAALLARNGELYARGTSGYAFMIKPEFGRVHIRAHGGAREAVSTDHARQLAALIEAAADIADARACVPNIGSARTRS